MLTVDDIKTFFRENASLRPRTSQEHSQTIPIIESWIGLEKDGKTVIKGKLHGHPQHPLGVKMMTSTIQRYFAGAGRVYVKTRNSLYELGNPLSELELSTAIPGVQKLERMTIWDC